MGLKNVDATVNFACKMQQYADTGLSDVENLLKFCSFILWKAPDY